MAAVSSYLQEEEAAAMNQNTSAVPPTGSQYQQSMWGQSGRQDMMTMRRLIQMRAFGRCR